MPGGVKLVNGITCAWFMMQRAAASHCDEAALIWNFTQTNKTGALRRHFAILFILFADQCSCCRWIGKSNVHVYIYIFFYMNIPVCLSLSLSCWNYWCFTVVGSDVFQDDGSSRALLYWARCDVYTVCQTWCTLAPLPPCLFASLCAPHKICKIIQAKHTQKDILI